MAAPNKLLFVVLIVSLSLSFKNHMVLASDPDMLQDICVADLTGKPKVNGFICLDTATPDNFFSNDLAKPGVPGKFGSMVTPANVMQIPGLNTLGVSMARIDFAPGGLNPPHTHPRGTEIIFVLYGELEVGFITTNQTLFPKTIYQGQIYVFPRGLVHFQKNNGKVPAAVISSFNSQLAGTQNIPLSLFKSNPPVSDYVLAQTFQISTQEVEQIKKSLATF